MGSATPTRPRAPDGPTRGRFPSPSTPSISASWGSGWSRSATSSAPRAGATTATRCSSSRDARDRGSGPVVPCAPEGPRSDRRAASRVPRRAERVGGGEAMARRGARVPRDSLVPPPDWVRTLIMSDEEIETERQRIVWKKGRKRRRSRFRKTFSRNLGYVSIRCVHAVVCRLPRSVGRGLAWITGTLIYYLLGRERRIALDGLTRVYGSERSPREIRILARAVFRHTVHVVIDWLIVRRWSRERVERRFPEVARAYRELDETHRAIGSGVVGVTGHF